MNYDPGQVKNYDPGQEYFEPGQELGGGSMEEQIVWRCEQWLGGEVRQQILFRSEQSARDFARRLGGVSPDLMFKIEPMPIQHVWN